MRTDCHLLLSTRNASPFFSELPAFTPRSPPQELSVNTDDKSKDTRNKGKYDGNGDFPFKTRINV